MADTLERLRALGAGLAIDDFGTGLSTLSQLKDLPFDTVKIDRSFLARHGGTQDENDGTVILGSIVALAHDLKRNVIVEGVEGANMEPPESPPPPLGLSFVPRRAIPGRPSCVPTLPFFTRTDTGSVAAERPPSLIALTV